MPQLSFEGPVFTQIVDEVVLPLCGDVLPDLDGHGRVRHVPPRRGAAVDAEGGRGHSQVMYAVLRWEGAKSRIYLVHLLFMC